jgi:hypothetical protein
VIVDDQNAASSRCSSMAAVAALAAAQRQREPEHQAADFAFDADGATIISTRRRTIEGQPVPPKCRVVDASA